MRLRRTSGVWPMAETMSSYTPSMGDILLWPAGSAPASPCPPGEGPGSAISAGQASRRLGEQSGVAPGPAPVGQQQRVLEADAHMVAAGMRGVEERPGGPLRSVQDPRQGEPRRIEDRLD